MRRSSLLLVFALSAGLLKPAPAEAYFWDWVDSLSGPQYHGATIEWKVWCKTNRPTKILASLRRDFADDLVRYQELAQRYPGRKDDLSKAIDAIRLGLDDLDNAMSASSSSGATDASVFLADALDQRLYAARVVRWVKKDKPQEKEPQQPSRTVRTRSALFGLGFGVAVSLCEAGKLERTSQYLAVDVGWGSDTKRDPQFASFATDNDPATDPNPDRNTLVTVGASYHAAINPWLTVGLGGGVASFSSRTRPAFRKWYVEPYIIDVRPVRGVADLVGFLRRRSERKGFIAALEPNKAPSQNPLPDILYFRYSSILFPTGFEADRFRGSGQFQAEFVRVYGVHLDLEPLIRKMRGTY